VSSLKSHKERGRDERKREETRQRREEKKE
jgi:hypothetical protein